MADEPTVLALPTGTVTFLLTDIEGSTRLWEEAPEQMTSAVPRHYEVLDDVIVRHEGVRPVEQGEGDSVVAAFARASDAVAAALDAQRALGAETPELRVRMAIHTGEAQLRDGQNYVGHAVIRCARLRACGRGGQVLVSEIAAGLVADRLPEESGLVDLGVHRLRDLSRPERVWQLVHPELPADFAPLRALDEFRHNLPAAATPLVGRAAELIELRSLVVDRRLVTITGSGGVGKTRLAQQVAADVVDQFADGVCWVELAAVTDPDQVVPTVARALGVTESAGVLPIDALLGHLRSTQLLLVVDNCEHLVGPIAGLLHRVLDGCPQTRVIATSRELLGVAGETTWRAPSLSVPASDGRLDDATAYDAVRLFVERAGQARPNFTLTRENASAVAHICSRLDGIPLAIELAAARVRTMPIDRLAAELDQRFRLLTGGSRTVMARQRTLLASIDWSHDLLDDDERLTLRRLSAFVGGFTLDAAEAVCADEHLDAYGLLDVLAQLVDKSLVQLDDRTGRYRMLETIRAFALDRASDAGDLPASRERHLAWARWITAGWDVEHVVPTFALVDEIEADYPNLLAAFEWSLEEDPAVDLLGPLSLLWASRSWFTEALAWTERILDRVPEGSPAWARALAHATGAFLTAGGPVFGLELLPTAIEVAERDGDDWAAGRLLLHHATALGALTLDPGCLELIQQGISRLQAVDDEGGVVHGLALEAFLNAMVCDTARAEELLVRLDALDLQDYCYSYLSAQAWGMIALQEGRYREVTPLLEEALEVAPPAPRAGLLFYLAQAAFLAGDVDRLEATLAAFPPAKQLGTWDWWHLVLRGELAYLRGDLDAAAAVAREAWQARSDGAMSTLAWVGAAQLAAGAGEIDLAETILGEIGLPDAERDPVWVTNTTLTVCLVALARSDPDRVERRAMKDLEFQRAQGHGPLAVADLELLACVGDADRAVRLAAAADRARAEFGILAFGPGVDHLRSRLDAARAELGHRFEDLWAEGQGLDWKEAADYVLRMRGKRGRPAHGWESLTPTELAVVDLVVEGLTNPQIAERMLVGTSTVKTHLHHVFTKLGLASRTELVAATLNRDGPG